MIDPTTVSLLTVVGSVGAAWGGVKVGLAGLQKTLTDHVTHDDQVQAKLAAELADSRLAVTDRLARIETKLDGLKK